MFTYTLDPPRRPIAQAFQATFIHASLIAGAVWATKTVPVTKHSKPLIDLTIFSPVHIPVPPCNCSVPSGPTVLGGPMLPPLPRVDIPDGSTAPLVDPRTLTSTGPIGPLTFGIVDTLTAASVFDESVVDELPTVMVVGQLRYPAVQREAGIEGTVTLTYVIDTEGHVEQEGIEVVSATLPGFVPAAEEAVLTSRFHPATKHHQPVRVRVRQTVTFSR